MDLLDREVASLSERGMTVTVCCLNRGELDRMTELAADYPHLQKPRLKYPP